MKERLDVLVVRQGFAASREQAKTLIMAGDIFVNGQREDKPGAGFDPSVQLECRGKKLAYVSRGGLKLEKALKVFPLQLQDAVCADIGASTGGFTDCMLQNGARKVYAIDCGYGQLAYQLRQDSRVVNMERTNIRYVEPGQLEEAADFISVDVSFISLTLVLPVMTRLLRPGGQTVCLIKPQFEAGRDKVGKKGVVREESTHAEVIEKVLVFAEEQGFTVLGLDYSPIKGPEGNIEYLMYAEWQGEANTASQGYLSRRGASFLADFVHSSHEALNGSEG